jgi:hypothetical protein
MEAVWTRFFPTFRTLSGRVERGDIGKVERVFADLSFRHDFETEMDPAGRMVNADLAGGVLLDREHSAAVGAEG